MLFVNAVSEGGRANVGANGLCKGSNPTFELLSSMYNGFHINLLLLYFFSLPPPHWSVQIDTRGGKMDQLLEPVRIKAD